MLVLKTWFNLKDSAPDSSGFVETVGYGESIASMHIATKEGAGSNNNNNNPPTLP